MKVREEEVVVTRQSENAKSSAGGQWLTLWFKHHFKTNSFARI